MFKGKWTYLWNLTSFGCIADVVAALKNAKSNVVCKIHDGAWTKWDTASMEQFREACRRAAIRFAVYGYIYLNDPRGEARLALSMIDKYEPDFYLIDAEGEAKGKFSQAQTFADQMVLASCPLGLNSYRFPHYHRELPWKQLRSCSDFDCPQVYYRNGDPVWNLAMSYNEFAAMTPKLPFVPAGDMYLEHGIKPSPSAVTRFLQKAKDDFGGAAMWVMDQKEKVPELWEAFATFPWDVSDVENPEPEPLPETQRWVRVTAGALNIRQGPSVSYKILGHYVSGDKAPVYEERYGWGRTDRGWISLYYTVPADDAQRWVRVTSHGLNVRQGPGVNYPVVSWLTEGNTVQVLEEKTGWGRMVKGWISLYYTAGV